MNLFFKWSVATLILAVIFHLAFVTLIPSAIMSIAFSKLQANFDQNEIIHAPRITSESRTVVSPSPDLIYSLCIFNLSDGPVKLSFGKSSNYASLALYGDNTDNFFSLNDRDIKEEGVDIILVHDEAFTQENLSNVIVITPPSKKGLVLIRRYFESEVDWHRAKMEQAGDGCRPFPS